jgi:multidrug resistance efflux pump
MREIAAVAGLAFAAGAFYWYRRPPAGHVQAAPALPTAVPVAEIVLTGIIQPAQVVNVPVPLDGTIDQFMAGAGQHVSEGEVLARIKNPKLAAAQQAAQLDAEQAQNHLRQLEAALIAARLEVSRSEADAIRVKLELDKAEKIFERQQTMFREGVTPRLTFEKAGQEYSSVKAESQKLVETARKAAERVDSTTRELDPARKALAQKTNELEDAQAEAAMGEVNSPADGVVIARRGKPGVPVTRATSDLFQIAVDPGVLEIVASIEPQAAARVHPGQAVAIQIAGMPSPTTNTVRAVKSGQIFIDLMNPSSEIKPGMTARIKIKLP